MSTCIYCEDNNTAEHFCCEICGDGMCEDCYNSEKEHSSHYQEITDSCEDENQAALIEAQKQGCILALATGRGYDSTQQFVPILKNLKYIRLLRNI